MTLSFPLLQKMQDTVAAFCSFPFRMFDIDATLYSETGASRHGGAYDMMRS